MPQRTVTEADFRDEIGVGWEEQRRMADFVGLWRLCARPACRRARRCRSARTECIFVHEDAFRGTFARLMESPLIADEDCWDK